MPKTAKKRIVRLGIDYGTSFSKIVFRDYGAPGGEKAYVLPYGSDFRIPSTVGVTSSEFIFGGDPEGHNRAGSIVWHQSVKMRVAGEVKGDYDKYCFGPLADLPPGFSAKDLAVLTVWFLISEAVRALREHFKGNPADVVIGFSLGMPMSFFDDMQLRRAFLDIARSAWEISKGLLASPSLSFQEARKILRFAEDEMKRQGDLPEEKIRDWIRTEAEAALWWPSQSPSVSEGPYAQVDIGAGTTNISIFRIVSDVQNGHRVKSRYSFFGADSPPVGMDAIDKALADWRQIASENPLSLRGQEREFFRRRGRGAVIAISDILNSLQKVYYRVIAKASATHRWSWCERDSWERHKVFFIGGGSQVEAIVKELQQTPIPGNEYKLHEIVPLEKPPDLFMADRTQIPLAIFPHVAVAYGLSTFAEDGLEVETPGEVPPMDEADHRPRNYRRLLEDDIDDWRFQ